MDPSQSYLIAYPLFRSYGMALTALLGFSVAFLSIGQAEFDPVALKSWLPYVLVCGAWPEIQFDYTVQGQHFNTGVYSPSHMIGQTGEPSDEMREIIANYPVGSTHTARYDPDEPHLAFLFVEKSAGMSRTVKLVMLALGLGALFLIVLTIATSSRA